MKGKAGAVHCVLAALCAVLAAAMAQGPQMEIFSDPAQGPSLEDGLRSLRPRMTLLLREGNHALHSTIFVRDIAGVTIRGDG
ncbi:hypothetical protein GBAR_LOCUS17926, partial [Geodia barretti]